jgi:hypothetical protein
MNRLTELMAGMTPRQRRDLILELMASQSNSMSPANFKGWLCGSILSNLLGQMPDEVFGQFCEVNPCDQPGCNCVKVSQTATEFFKFLRDDFAQEMLRRKSIPNN